MMAILLTRSQIIYILMIIFQKACKVSKGANYRKMTEVEMSVLSLTAFNKLRLRYIVSNW